MEYPRTITLRDGKNETMLTEQDFEYLVDKYMGFEALRFLRELRESGDTEISELVQENSDLRKEISYLRSKLREEGVDFAE